MSVCEHRNLPARRARPHAGGLRDGSVLSRFYFDLDGNLHVGRDQSHERDYEDTDDDQHYLCPVNFFVGVYGMNMPIPENNYWFSYPIFWIFSVLLSLIMLRWFKQRGWF